jgi:phospholipid transport system substrate-binding protein
MSPEETPVYTTLSRCSYANGSIDRRVSIVVRRPAMKFVRWFVRILLVMVVVSVAVGDARAAPDDAGAMIRRLYDTLLTTMKSGSSLGIKGRYHALKPVIGQTFDLPYMARATVGSAWTQTPPQQQQAMVNAFWRYTSAVYADRFSSYASQQFQVTGEHPHGHELVVDSRIVKADGTPVIVRYLMHETGGTWLVADIYLDGTVSELATRRSEFASILQQGGIATLIETLNRKAEALGAGP